MFIITKEKADTQHALSQQVNATYEIQLKEMQRCCELKPLVLNISQEPQKVKSDVVTVSLIEMFTIFYQINDLKSLVFIKKSQRYIFCFQAVLKIGKWPPCLLFPASYQAKNTSKSRKSPL